MKSLSTFMKTVTGEQYNQMLLHKSHNDILHSKTFRNLQIYSSKHAADQLNSIWKCFRSILIPIKQISYDDSRQTFITSHHFK